MSVALDTNILARSVQASHPMHDTASKTVEAFLAEGETVCVLAQSLYEFWVVATRPQEQNGLALSVDEASAHIATFEAIFSLMLDTPEVYGQWKTLVNRNAVSGKNAHDARIVAAMVVSHGWSRSTTPTSSAMKVSLL